MERGERNLHIRHCSATIQAALGKWSAAGNREKSTGLTPWARADRGLDGHSTGTMTPIPPTRAGPVETSHAAWPPTRQPAVPRLCDSCCSASSSLTRGELQACRIIPSPTTPVILPQGARLIFAACSGSFGTTFCPEERIPLGLWRLDYP